MIVSNTSPIINLACIGQLDLLPALFGTVVIPPAVFAETSVTLPDAPGAAASPDGALTARRSPASLLA